MPARFVHFAHGAVITWGAYVAYLVLARSGYPVIVAAVVAMAVCAAMGAMLENGVYARLRRRGAPNLILLVASLGLYVVLENLAGLMFSEAITTVQRGRVNEGYALLGARIVPAQLWCIVTCALVLGAAVLLRLTRFGRAYRAVADNPGLAAACGLSVPRVLLGTFATGSAVAAVAGSIMLMDVGVTPTSGLSPLIAGVAAMILGGVGSTLGMLCGGLFLAFVQQLVVWEFGGSWVDGITFLVLLVFLLARPQGLFGSAIHESIE